MRAAASSTSASVVGFPTLSRRVPLAYWSGSPIALSTWLTRASSWLWQAAPAEHSTRCSILARTSGASTFLNETERVLGRRSVGCPFTSIVATPPLLLGLPSSWSPPPAAGGVGGKRASSALCSRLRRAPRRGSVCGSPNSATSQAAPSPAARSVFSVPALFPPSWPAPNRSFCSGGEPRLLKSAPMPLGAYNLCPVTVR
mmetsp:Transcript_50142/g.93214  ORF Transcript_50142/g.93214 Transcript_50142/m.93214 type:complete len:200 (+) Transcript_50142:215-814(+)